MKIPIPLIPVELNVDWRSEKKEESKTPVPSALLVIDRDFLLTVALFIVLYGAFITVAGMALARAAKS